MSGRRGRDCDWRAWLSRRDGAARDRLIAAHLPLVGATITRAAPAAAVAARGLSADLHGAGWAALARALCAYDPARARFETLAVSYVRAAVREALRDDDHLSRHYRESAGRGGLGRLSLPPASLEAPLRAGAPQRAVAGEDGGPVCLGDALAAPDDTAAAALARVEAARVRAAVAALPARERAVVCRRYWGGETLAGCGRGLREGGGDVGEAMGHRLHGQALRRLREAMGG